MVSCAIVLIWILMMGYILFAPVRWLIEILFAQYRYQIVNTVKSARYVNGMIVGYGDVVLLNNVTNYATLVVTSAKPFVILSDVGKIVGKKNPSEEHGARYKAVISSEYPNKWPTSLVVVKGNPIILGTNDPFVRFSFSMANAGNWWFRWFPPEYMSSMNGIITEITQTITSHLLL